MRSLASLHAGLDRAVAHRARLRAALARADRVVALREAEVMAEASRTLSPAELQEAIRDLLVRLDSIAQVA